MKFNIRNISAYFLAIFLIAFGFVRRARERALRGEYIINLCFHHPGKREFEACIMWLKKHGFTILSLDDLYTILYQKLPFPKGGVVLTADDGWQSNEANIVEVATRYQVPVTIFVSTEPVEEGAYWWSYIQKARKLKLKVMPVKELKLLANASRLRVVEEAKTIVAPFREAMTVEQVKRVADSNYVTIGGHTHTHPVLVNCGIEELYNELTVSRARLEGWVGKEVSYFAYPNGDFGEREKLALKDSNYKLAFTIRAEYLRADSIVDPYTLPRFCFLEGASFAENVCRMCGIWHPLIHKIKSLLPVRRGYKVNAPDHRTILSSP
ncbi:MAG TPA: polysaccharide deacetylase family protein [Pontibacter sp.]